MRPAFLHAYPLHLCLWASMLSLAACQASTVTPAEKPFIEAMQSVLANDVTTATQGKLSGAVDLKVTLDRQSRPVACSTQPGKPEYAAKLPAEVVRSAYPVLARAVERQCWKTIYPLVPSELYGGEETVQITAPIVIVAPWPTLASDHPWRIHEARKAFFWQQLMREQPVDSVGQAVIRYQADAQGKVTGCLVDLAPVPQRTDAFRLDGQLQADLSRRCMQLDLRDMPSFMLEAQAPAENHTVVEYAPWKVGRQ
ncbi:hypothetical protein KNHN1_30630 [Pseudomonas guariconensis]